MTSRQAGKQQRLVGPRCTVLLAGHLLPLCCPLLLCCHWCPWHSSLALCALQVSALAWRPMYSSMLAVGCTGGVCLWSLGTGAQPGSDSPSEGSPPMAFLPFSSSTAAVSSLAWSPDGRLLVGSSHQWPGLVVWDVASGRAEPMRAVTAALQLLRYSPCGNYLFAGERGGVAWGLALLPAGHSAAMYAAHMLVAAAAMPCSCWPCLA